MEIVQSSDLCLFDADVDADHRLLESRTLSSGKLIFFICFTWAGCSVVSKSRLEVSPERCLSGIEVAPERRLRGIEVHLSGVSVVSKLTCVLFSGVGTRIHSSIFGNLYNIKHHTTDLLL